MSYGLGLRLRRGPRPRRRHHRHHDRPRLRSQSAEMAAAHGPLPRLPRRALPAESRSRSRQDNVEPMLEVIERHRESVREHPGLDRFARLKHRGASSAGTPPSPSAASTATATRRSPSSPPPAPSASSWIATPPASSPTSRWSSTSSSPAAACSRSSTRPSAPRSSNSATRPRQIDADHRPHRQERHHRGVRDEATADHPQRVEARASAVFDCAFKPAQGRAHPPLPRPYQDDGRRAAVPLRRDLEDGQPAQDRHRRGHHEDLHRGVETRPQGHGHLPRRLQALRPARRQETTRHRQRRGRPGRRPRGGRAARRPHPRAREGTRRPAHPGEAPSGTACPTPASRSPTSSTSPATRATSPSACSRTTQPGRTLHPHGKEGSTIGGLMDTIGHARLALAAIRRAAREPGEEIRLPALRAERLHQEPRHPQRQIDHRLRLPLARHASSSKATRRRPPRTPPSRTSR